MGGKGGGGGGSSTTVQKADPWGGQQPYLKESFSEAQKLYNSGQLAPGYYSGNTVAPMDAATKQALALQESRAKNGSPLIDSAQSQLTKTMSGSYQNSNPFIKDDGGASKLSQWSGGDGRNLLSGWSGSQWNGNSNAELDNMVQRAIGQSNAGVAGNYAAAGRYGSGAFNAAANDAAGNIATQMYGQAYDQDQNRSLSAWDSYQNRNLSAWDANQGRTLEAYNAGQNRNLSAWDANQNRQIQAYNAGRDRYKDVYTNERDNQIKGMMFAPQLAAQDYQDLAALSEVGTARENYKQQDINAAIDKYNYNANRNASALQNYSNLINGNYGMSGSSTATGQSKSNPLGGAMSGALAGGGIASMMGASNPWIAGAAGLGGLLGLF